MKQHCDEIVEFVKGAGKQRVGVMIAKRFGDAVLFGWSRAAINRRDEFNPEIGLAQAKDRLSFNASVPASFKRHASAMRGRAARYFSECPSIFVFSVMPYEKMPKRPPKSQRAHKPYAAYLQEKGIMEPERSGGTQPTA